MGRNIWIDGFECCAGQELESVPHGVILRSAQANGNTVGPGLQIFANEFNGGGVWYEGKQGTDIDTRLTLTGVRIQDNSFTANGVGTRAKQTLRVPGPKAAGSFEFDFCSKLLFPQIASVR